MNGKQTICLHGSFGSRRIMRQDVGIDTWMYLDWTDRKEYKELIANIRRWYETVGPLCLAGYSLGGNAIADLSWLAPELFDKAILYESPMLNKAMVGPEWKGSVLWVENDRGRRTDSRKFESEMAATFEAWRVAGELEEMQGKGRHVRWHAGWPPVRHNWDQRLNTKIKQWVAA